MLAGKDYFTSEEAAQYACVSHSQWRAKVKDYGIPCFSWMGKKVYRKLDIQKAMELAWQESTIAKTGNNGTRTSRTKRASATGVPLAQRNRKRSNG